MNCLEAIPDELKLFILSFLDIPSVGVMSRISKKWRELSDSSSLWNQLCTRDFDISHTDQENWKEFYRESSGPLHQDPRFLSCCYGLLGEHNAVQKLKGKPEGTFLFRSSNTDAEAVTVSFVDSGNVVRHRRMHRIVTVYGAYGGFTFNMPSYKKQETEKVAYKNYWQLIKNNSAWLKYPLVSDITVSQQAYYCKRERIDIHPKNYEGPPSSSEINFVAQILRSNNTVARDLRVMANIYFGCKIGQTDLLAIVVALQENQTVQYFAIAHMHLDLMICQAISKLLTCNDTLKKISFLHCSCDSKAADTIIETLQTGHVKTLNLIILNGKQYDVNAMKNITANDFTEFECQPWACTSTKYV
mmetsp:Transcript_24869/g.34823  ORF Transcript_24869/g.34823 Transcript_24869/m.34823 type:complete len:359 (+) Transcript_24869:2-1078(+)